MTEQATVTPAEAIAALGLTVDAVFVPFSKSRNKDQKHHSLNWRFTINRNGREVLTGDYSAGEGHCPAKATEAPATYRARDRFRANGTPYPGTSSPYRAPTKAEALSDYLGEWRRAECESGLAMEHSAAWGTENFKPKKPAAPIMPDPVNVIWSCLMDADAIDHPSFESWAADYGYDTDSRTAEATYRTCLDMGLKMRAALGEEGLRQLRDAFQDY